MPTVVPALPLALPLSVPAGTGVVGDLFAALVQRLAGSPEMDVAPGTPAGGAALGGAAMSAASDGAEPLPATDASDPVAMPDATIVPPLVALPASTLPPLEPPAANTLPTADGRPGAMATTSDASVVAFTPSDREPPARVGRAGGDMPSLATDHPETGSQRVATGTAVGAPRASEPSGDPVPTTPPRLLEAAASPPDASAGRLVPSDGPPALVQRSAEPLGAVPIDGRAETPPGAAIPPNRHSATLAMASASGSGRKGQDLHAAMVPDCAADSAVATTVADRAATVRIDPPIETTAANSPADARAEGPRGLLSSAGPPPLSSDGPDAGPVGLTPQLTVAIVRQATDGLDRVKVKLQPEELGTVEVALELGDHGRARATFLAERPETVDLLRREAGDLERALRQVGVEVATSDMSFAPRNPHGGRDQEPGTRVPVPWGDLEPQAARHGPSPTTSHGISSRLLDLTV